VLAVAERIADARAVATIAAPSSTSFLRERLLASSPELATEDEAEVDVAGRRVRIRRELLEDLREEHVSAGISGLDRPLLIFHSPTDEVVGIENATRIYKAASHPKSFVSLDGADHLLLARESDARFIGSVMAAWASRYLEASPESKADAEQLRPAQGEVIVEADGDSFMNRIRTVGHDLIADEPISLGGTNAGPTPYGLLLASLGACKSITLSMYAERKGWPLESIRVFLRHQQLHARDCEECQSDGGRVDRIDVELEIGGELDASQRQRLLEISKRCPVHRTLTSETSIRSTLLDEELESSS
jgi:putative redox protein